MYIILLCSHDMVKPDIQTGDACAFHVRQLHNAFCFEFLKPEQKTEELPRRNLPRKPASSQVRKFETTSQQVECICFRLLLKTPCLLIPCWENKKFSA